jgi:hypothetical protein
LRESQGRIALESNLIKNEFAWLLTARQYGEVVLPDEASGQGPDTLARKLSRCKEGMAHFLPSRYKVL